MEVLIEIVGPDAREALIWQLRIKLRVGDLPVIMRPVRKRGLRQRRHCLALIAASALRASIFGWVCLNLLIAC
jgi:hypothetical protein